MQNEDSKSSLHDPKVRAVLDRLHREARGDELRFGMKMLPYLIRKSLGRNPSFTDQYHRMEGLSIPISPEQGTFAYLVARSISATRMVEFGTSFGVSTIYLAAAVRDNGGGIVIGSEFVEAKVAKAKAHLEEVGLADYCEIRPGDAMQTLADLGGTVDMVLMDGSKDLYLPLIKILAPQLRKGAVVLADNVLTVFVKKALGPYVEFMKDVRNGFFSVTVPFPDGFEFSLRL